MEYLDSHSLQGVPMPLYLSQHTLACLTRQGADALALRFESAAGAKAERILVNMVEGKMFCEFRAASREALEPGSTPKACTSTGSCASSGRQTAVPCNQRSRAPQAASL